jgi:hypothetical protein
MGLTIHYALSVKSPIFDCAHFERLEHEGRQSFGRPVGDLRKKRRAGLC